MNTFWMMFIAALLANFVQSSLQKIVREHKAFKKYYEAEAVYHDTMAKTEILRARPSDADLHRKRATAAREELKRWWGLFPEDHVFDIELQKMADEFLDEALTPKED